MTPSIHKPIFLSISLDKTSKYINNHITMCKWGIYSDRLAPGLLNIEEGN